MFKNKPFFESLATVGLPQLKTLPTVQPYLFFESLATVVNFANSSTCNCRQGL
jgi:hypothetical protein